MANTTFKGPVRSQNGFQEWDGSAWVPVAGGGGGGGSHILLTPDNAYGEIGVGVTSGVEVTVSTLEPGQSVKIVLSAQGYLDYFAGTPYVWKINLPQQSTTGSLVMSNTFRNSYPDPYYVRPEYLGSPAQGQPLWVRMSDYPYGVGTNPYVDGFAFDLTYQGIVVSPYNPAQTAEIWSFSNNTFYLKDGNEFPQWLYPPTLF
jgi:hypothetical protein